MATELLGYARLIADYNLNALPLMEYSLIDSAVKGRDRRAKNGQTVLHFSSHYAHDNSLTGHLQFALKYEGVNLYILSLLFAQPIQANLESWIRTSPASSYARRICFLYEWITNRKLANDFSVPKPERYVNVADGKLQFVLPVGEKDLRFRVLNNLPGTAEFCPMVRKTEYLQSMVVEDLRAQVIATVANYDQDLLKRAANFLYLKETQSSFEVEREKPSPNKAQRFADMLKQANSKVPLTERRLIELQNITIDPRFREFTWRSQQNWLGKDHGYRQQIDFVPPRPEDVPHLMNGLIETVSKIATTPETGSDTSDVYDPVILSAAVSFGFVFIHPFMDGNGRIHRYLIHDVLARTGFTPRGIILPVSAVIVANLDEYIDVLETFSRPMRDISDYDPNVPTSPATGNDPECFRFFDATPQAEFLYHALKRTLEEDLPKEIEFLLGFDRAYGSLNQLMDWPSHNLELFIRVVHQHEGTLSLTKRKSHFDWMSDVEIKEAELAVRQAFDLET